MLNNFSEGTELKGYNVKLAMFLYIRNKYLKQGFLSQSHTEPTAGAKVNSIQLSVNGETIKNAFLDLFFICLPRPARVCVHAHSWVCVLVPMTREAG